MRVNLSVPFALIVAAALLTVQACDLKGDKGQEDLTIVVEADRSKLTAQEKELALRLEEFEKERERLRAEREELMQSKETIKDKDASQLQRIREMEKRLWSKERSMWKRETDLDQEKRQLETSKTRMLVEPLALPKAGAGVSLGGREAGMARRETSLAGREKDLALREKRVAQREEAVATREKALAARESQAPTTRIVNVTRSESGSGRVSKKQAQRAYKRARKLMGGKGILHADLPPELQGVQADIKAALNKKDYRTARDLSEQLRAALSAMVVDEGFIKRKFARLNDLSRKKSPKSDAKKKEVKSLLRKATQLVADGQFGKANRHLNRIYSLLR